MVGTLYYISNTINNKLYIGITYRPLHVRWLGHLSSANNGTSKLYQAMREIGRDKFSIHEIDKLPYGELERAETNTIIKYDTVNNGYNTTYGGEHPSTIDGITYRDILNDLIKGDLSLIDVASKYKVSMMYLKHVAYNEGINTIKDNYNNITNKKIGVICIGISAEHIYEFESMSEAYKWLVNFTGRNIKKGHFYYQVRYAINTGKIAYKNRWFTTEHIHDRIRKGLPICASLIDETKPANLMHKTNIKYMGVPILYSNKTTVDEVKNTHKNPFDDRQVPPGTVISYPFIKEEMQLLYPKYTANSIAKHVGVSCSTVNKWLIRFGLK